MQLLPSLRLPALLTTVEHLLRLRALWGRGAEQKAEAYGVTLLQSTEVYRSTLEEGTDKETIHPLNRVLLGKAMPGKQQPVA